jgi:hypothetical protein
MTRDNIIRRVKVEMDELTPFDSGLVISAGNEESKPIDKYIDEILDQCAHKLILLAPVHLLSLTAHTPTITVTDTVALFDVPADFLGLGYLKFPEWERPVYNTIKETDPLYLRQKNIYTRAGVSKPVVALCTGSTVPRLECYTITSSNGAGIVFKYRAKILAELLPDNLIPALAYLTAAEIFKIFERPELVQPTMELFSNELNIR